MSSHVGKPPSKAVLAHGFGSPGCLPPPSSPQAPWPTLCHEILSSAHCRTSFRGKGWFRGSQSMRGPHAPGESRLTFHTHAVVKAFVVEAPVVGRAEMPPQVTAGPCRYSKHSWSAKLRGPSPPPGTRSPRTGDPSSLWQGRALAGWGHLVCKARSRSH